MAYTKQTFEDGEIVYARHLNHIEDGIEYAHGLENRIDTLSEKLDDATEAYTSYNEFWDIYQRNGARTDYGHAFAGLGWTTTTFKPKYDINVTNAQYIFASATDVPDMAAHLESLGRTLSFAECTSFAYMLYWSGKIARLGVIDTRSATSVDNMIYGAPGLITIDKIILKDDGSQSLKNIFHSAAKLANITFEGTIGYNGVNFPCNNLTVDSLLSIIAALKDYSDSGSTYTCTLGPTNLAKLTDAQKAVAQQKGWTLT